MAHETHSGSRRQEAFERRLPGNDNIETVAGARGDVEESRIPVCGSDVNNDAPGQVFAVGHRRAKESLPDFPSPITN